MSEAEQVSASMRERMLLVEDRAGHLVGNEQEELRQVVAVYTGHSQVTQQTLMDTLSKLGQFEMAFEHMRDEAVA